MKDLFVWFCVAFIAVCGCVLSYRAGAASVPIKYAICENGTCVLSDVPPAY
jgi:hypothetical protein